MIIRRPAPRLLHNLTHTILDSDVFPASTYSGHSDTSGAVGVYLMVKATTKQTKHQTICGFVSARDMAEGEVDGIEAVSGGCCACDLAPGAIAPPPICFR